MSPTPPARAAALRGRQVPPRGGATAGRAHHEQRLDALLAATAVPAALLLLGCALRLPDQGPGAAGVVVALLVVLAELPLLRVRVGAHQVAFGSSGAAVAIGLVTLPPTWLVVLVGPTMALSHLLQRRPARKALFRGAVGALSVGVAAVVLALLGGRPDVVTTGGVLALVLATAACAGTEGLLTGAAVALARRSAYREVLLRGGGASVLVLAGDLALAVGVLLLHARTPAVLLAVPPVAALLALTRRACLRAAQERDVWRQLEVASRELNRLEEREVAAAALRRARELFRCSDVELVLDARGGERARTWRLVDGRLVALADASGRRQGQTRWVELDEQGAERPVTTCLATPLDSPSGRIGALRLLFEGSVSLSPRERQVLLTYAHAVSTTLQNARLHEDVRAEAARHAHDAGHDALTGLANRLLLQQETEAALASGEGTALLLLDLDHFKEINDTLGHSAGDLLLQQVAARLEVAVGDEGLVARLGGDEFAVLLTGLSGPAQAEPLACRLLQALAVPVEFEGLRLSVEGSLGLACAPQDAATAAELFRRADVAMYQAKTTRGAWLRYDPDRDDSSVHRLALVSELRQALERDEVLVHVQPQVDLRTGRVVSAEALCRWQHPTRGLLAPDDFVGVVEQSGLARPFTLRVLELALTACAQWHADGHPVRIAVNLAARSLLDRSLPDDVAAVLARTGVRPQDLVLEITETTATSELEVVEDVLAQLRRTGVEISVDDFGTGYSSLAFLQRTAVNELKVDRSFVRGMLRNDNDAALVRATVQLAHSLGARAVAEGVEDVDHARALRELGCDVAQGWLYGRAVPPEQLRARLARAEVVLPVQGGGRLLRLDAQRLGAQR